MPAKRDSASGKAKAARTKTTRKPPAAKRSPKPPAKRRPSTQAKTPAREAGKRIKSGWRRNVADRWVIHWRTFERLPWAEVCARDGRKQRTLEVVVNDYLENVREGDVVRPLERDPIELIESMLSELTIMRDTMVALVEGSADEKVVVAAGREWRRLMKEVRELLQGVGKLPKELGTMRHLVEVREMADLLDKLLDRLEAGSITPAEVRAQIAEWSGVAPIDAESEPMDADVVPDADVSPADGVGSRG